MRDLKSKAIWPAIYLFLAILPISAEPDNIFLAATCEISDVEDLGDTVSLILWVRLHNQSDSNQVFGELVVRDRRSAKELASVPAIHLEAWAAGLWPIQTILPLHDYSHWKEGGEPADGSTCPSARPGARLGRGQ